MSKSFKVMESDSGIKFAQVGLNFKVTKEGSVLGKEHPEYVGKKRESFTYNFGLIDSYEPEVNLVLNEALASYVKNLVSDNDGDWTYRPRQEDITIAELAKYILRPSAKGTRIYTIANIREFMAFIQDTVIEVIGKSEGYFTTVLKVAEQKFTPLAGMPEKIISVQNVLGDDRISELVDSDDCPEKLKLVYGAILEKLVEVSEVREQELTLEALD